MFQWPFLIIIVIIIIISGCSSSIPELNYTPTEQYSLDKYSYSVDLTRVKNDRVYVHLHCPGLRQERVIFHFPKTIPGTFRELDYGEMIQEFKAKDSQGDSLPVQKIGNNIFEITQAEDLATIHYWVDDTWDHPKAKMRIWPMGGTNIEDSTNFVINASGWFGFFEELENVPVQLALEKPDGTMSFSALPSSDQSDEIDIFRARNYHHLIDCPIMVSKPDTTTFIVSNTKIHIESFHANGQVGYAEVIKKEIQPSIEAVATFTDSLPVYEYHFILYISDGKKLMETLQSKEEGFFTKAKTVMDNVTLFGSGALEHGNSSFYALTDFGDTTFTSMIKRVALHEFMHIFTPLNLHSKYIGDFDYVNPQMSKHLWLYEGITEYFASLILVQAGLITPKEFFSDRLSKKISSAARYPEKKISFTEMSENVFQKKYQRHYYQVYKRGALIGLLLDIEIIRLTNGKKTLKDVVIELAGKYGPNRSFNEQTFFDEFTSLVHPELRQWFKDHVEGTVPLDVAKGLDLIGVEYSKNGKHVVSKRIFKDYGSKTYMISMGKYRKIKKVGEKDPIGFFEGDQVDTEHLEKVLYDDLGYPVKENTIVDIFIKRDGKIISLPYTVEHKERKYKHRLRMMKDPSKSQSNYYSIWMGN